MRIPFAIGAENNSVILLFCSWTLDVGRWTLGVFLMLKRVPAVDLSQHGFHFWIALTRLPDTTSRARAMVHRADRWIVSLW